MPKFVLALCMLGAALAGHTTGSRAATAQLNSVQSVDYAMLHAGEALIRIDFARALTQRPSGFRTFHPAARVVLELPDTSVAQQRKTVQPERGLVRSIRLLGHANGTRLVIELAAPATYETAIDGRSLLITLRRTPRASQPHHIHDVRFERGANGEGRVVVPLTDAAAGIDVRQQGRRLIVSFFNTRLAPASQLRLDVLDFATPIAAIESRAAGADTRLVIETSGSFEYSARQSDSGFTLTVAPSLR